MSYSVLVIPEDPTNNGYILRPLVLRIMAECGKPNARVNVLTDPKTEGYEAAKALLVGEVADRWRHMDLFLFLPDADGNYRAEEFARLERIAADKGVQLVCCAAVQEVETWLLAGHVDKLNQPWGTIRADVDVKENVFQPFLAQYGDSRRAGGGRDILMQETLTNLGGLLQRCPELQMLRGRIVAILGETQT